MSTTQFDPASLDDQYDYSLSLHLQGIFGQFRRFLWFCAGADLKLMMRCPHSDRVKFDGLGGVVLATTVLAFLSGSYAFYTVFGPRVGLALDPAQQSVDVGISIMSVVFGLVWALIIFNLDRFIVTSSGHGDGTENITLGEVWKAMPRIMMALMIGVSLSKPLEIRIMKSEIEARLNQEQATYAEGFIKKVNEEYRNKRQDLEALIAKIESENKTQEAQLEDRRQKIDKQRVERDLEASGQAASGRRGIGDVWRSMDENLRKMEAEREIEVKKYEQQASLRKSEIARMRAEIDQLGKERDASIQKKYLEARSLDGLSKRIQVAHDIAPAITWALTLLLIVIEITPVFIKMMLIRGSYDFLVDNQTQIVIAKYGIEPASTLGVSSLGGGEHVGVDRFHQAETIRDYVVGSLTVERNLAKVAQDTFEQRVRKDIPLNPDKYVDTSSRST